MTTFSIKLIAILAMIVDHIGLFFFPHTILFRIIGRLSFPLFAWLIANGAHHTHDIKAYLVRLLSFAVFSQIPFILANNLIGLSWYLNVLFTLFLGLLAISVIRKTSDKRIWLAITVVCSLAAYVFNTDYGIEGVLSIIFFYLFFDNKRYLVLSQILIFIFPLALFIESAFYYHLRLPSTPITYIEPIGLLSLIFVLLYSSKEGIKAKYLFYVFFPLQYFVIFIVKMLLR